MLDIETSGMKRAILAALVTVYDARGEARTVPVVVRATGFSGETRCVSTTGNFEGAPTGSETRTSMDLISELTWLTGEPNRRLLLRRGEAWTGAEAYFGGDGPAILGAYEVR